MLVGVAFLPPHSPYISIVLYRVTLVQDSVLALHARTTLPRALCRLRVRRLKLGLALRLLCKGLFYGRAMSTANPA